MKSAMNSKQVLEFWGKARSDTEMSAAWHPLAYHLLDVAAVADAFLNSRPFTLKRAGYLLGLAPDKARHFLVRFIALHDLGKFAPRFQALATPEGWAWPTALLGVDASRYEKSAHTTDGLLLWNRRLREEFAGRIWNSHECPLEAIENAVFGHHGRPVEDAFGRLQTTYSDGAIEAARGCANLILNCLQYESVEFDVSRRKSLELSSWWIAGFITICDWIGSRAEWFPYTSPLPNDDDLTRYWELATSRAVCAVREAGVDGLDPSLPQSFLALTGKHQPTPTQQWASTVDLPDGPVLAIIEDATGSGKTEAAHMLVHRFMTSGRASGAYWGMPTQATANAMYGRQRKAISALFAPNQRRLPSLTLGHGQAKLHEAYQTSVIRDPELPVTQEFSDSEHGDDPSDVACAAFLADDRRAALLADLGAGTIDQAILGVLPSKFNAVRLFGLSEKVLVFDEVHAYDTYMSQEIVQLLRFHAALGGSAVVLSATLAEPARRMLEQAWHGCEPVWVETPEASIPSPYPLTTIVSSRTDIIQYFEPMAAPWTVRLLPTRQVRNEDEALEYVLCSVAQGAAVVWIRNTVAQCHVAAERLGAAGVTPMIFHSRFAQGDRQKIEQDVIRRFGKESTTAARSGTVLVATQVVEQSLDLDFDVMVSDLAPIDLLIQRAGRLWRHTRVDRPTAVVSELVVLAPECSENVTGDWLHVELPHTRSVYGDVGVLWRTATVLNEHSVIKAPHNIRQLIASVYESETVPAVFERAVNAATGTDRANAAFANGMVLPLGPGYTPGRSWTTDIRAPTRLGDERVTVRLARAVGTEIIPWFVNADMPLWKLWHLSEVQLNVRHFSRSEVAAKWASQITRVRSEWGKYEQGLPIIVLEPTESEWCNGTAIAANGRSEFTVRYSPRTGLQI